MTAPNKTHTVVCDGRDFVITRLTLTHSGLPVAEDVPDHPWGWTSALDKFAGLLEQRPAQTP